MAKNSHNDDISRYEELFAGEDRKLDKLERKIKSAHDRSKYKKTDRAKFEKGVDIHKNIKVPREQLLRGRVLSVTSQGHIVESDGRRWICVLRGLLKKEKTLAKNLVTVGDFVLFEAIDDDEGLIAHVEPRRTVLSRADSLQARKQQILAANIDQVLITVSVVVPPLKPHLVDRYIIATRKGGMEPVVVVNKIDLLDDPANDQERALYEEFLQAYKKAEIPVVVVSVLEKRGLDDLEAVMRGKASVFSGQSGAGKSSLINALTGLDLPVGEPVAKTKKGAHTTTTAHLITLDCGGWCIDTPGIKSFGLWDLEKEDIEPYFSEIHRLKPQCKFPDCSHTHEEGCVVKDAVASGDIASLRYASYQALLEKAEEEKRRR